MRKTFSLWTFWVGWHEGRWLLGTWQSSSAGSWKILGRSFQVWQGKISSVLRCEIIHSIQILCWSVFFVSTQDNIPDTVIQKIQPYIENEDFQPAAIAKVRGALRPHGTIGDVSQTPGCIQLLVILKNLKCNNHGWIRTTASWYLTLQSGSFAQISKRSIYWRFWAKYSDCAKTSQVGGYLTSCCRQSLKCENALT